MSKRQRIFPVFYLLFAYVLIQFSWWAYSIVRLNSEIIQLRSELAAYQGLKAGQTQNIEAAIESKMIMVAGEGTVFLILLLAGAFYILRSFKREIAIQSQQKNFMLSVTHELKSPLASVKLYLQTLLKRDLNPEKQKEITKHALSDTERLGNLIDNILTASRLDGGRFSLHMEQDHLSQYVQKICRAHFQQGLSSHQLETHIEPDLFASFDKQVFSIILGNLLENAIKYSPPASKVMVALNRQQGKFVLVVADEGPGIPSVERTKVFQKFYRIGNEETRQSKGTGLGLYIVKNLCQMAKIQLIIEDNLPKGSRFVLEWV